MFIGFFYLLRAYGFNVSVNEWMTLTEALTLDRQHTSLTGFYHLCRAVLIKSESEYDKFDKVFLEYFDGVPFEDELPEELMRWLDHPERALDDLRAFLRAQGCDEKDAEEILRMFAERLREQKEEHNGGNYWIGTGGTSNFGHGGFAPQGVRVGGTGRHRRAFQVAGERRFRDFRKDNVLDVRQFQMAFRLLRQYSGQTLGEKTEFDVDGTIRETCDNAGTLRVCWKRPRRNTVKLLMLMDSGGSMEYWSRLCSMLFQAAERANQFKELHVYYFHNCIYSSVYTDPRMHRSHAVPTEWLLKNFDGAYRVILVGDALMDMYELTGKRWYTGAEGEQTRSGLDWLKCFKEHYPHLVWLNPEGEPSWGPYWGQSYGVIQKLIDMFPLSVDGLERSMKKLLVSK